MIEQIYVHATQMPDRVAVADGDMRLTYSDLTHQVDQLIKALQRVGFGKGQRLLFMDTNKAGYMMALLACMQCGVTLVPAPPQAPKAWQDRLISAFDINAIVEGIVSLQKGDFLRLNSTVVEEDPDDIVAIFTTSGTTGMPKGVPIHMKAVRAAVSNTIETFALDETAIFINYVPPFTVGGLLFSGLPILIAGSSNFLLPFAPFSFATDMARYQPTHTFLLPAMISMLRTTSNWPELDLSCLKYVGSGASPVSESMANDLLERGVGCFLHVYGSTECLTPVMRHPSVLSSGKKIVFSEMCGDYEMKLAEDGELLLRGTPITRGYLDDPANNHRSFENGWFKTGDLFEYDGPVWRFIGRKKQMLKVGGFSVFPVLTESIIMDLPGVRNCCVAAGTTRSGVETLVAVIEGNNVDQRTILNHCRDQLPRHQMPRRVIFVEHIPLNAMRKVDRSAVAEMISL